jgi:hypothetical protein
MLHPCPLFFQYFRSSSKKHDSTWSQNAESTTYTEGGDPAIKSFNSDTEWTAWAQSVEKGSSIVTSHSLELIHMLIPAGARRDNVLKAVSAYAAANNISFPAAELANYKMGWCDCKNETIPCGDDADSCPLECSQPGYVVTSIGVTKITQKDGWEIVPDNYRQPGAQPMRCCRPCFQAGN